MSFVKQNDDAPVVGQVAASRRAIRSEAAWNSSTTVIQVEDREGVIHELEPVEGWRLMEILRDYGVGMDNTCGGALACAECHVVIDPEWVAKVAAAARR